MSLRLNSSGGGSVTLQEPATASALTLDLPAVNGTVITTGDTGTVSQTMLGSNVTSSGPAFYAFLPTNQSVGSGSPTKVNLSSESFDTASAFDTTNYRFLPLVAGYYQINACATLSSASALFSVVSIYKNGSAYSIMNTQKSNANYNCASVSTIVYLNGSTDYVEMFAWESTATTIISTSPATFMCGSLVRSA